MGRGLYCSGNNMSGIIQNGMDSGHSLEQYGDLNVTQESKKKRMMPKSSQSQTMANTALFPGGWAHKGEGGGQEKGGIRTSTLCL